MSYKRESGKFVFCFFRLGILAAGILFLSSSDAEAVDIYWNVPSGDWSDTDPFPWNPSPEPTSSDNAYINNGGTANITQSGETCQSLYLGYSSSSTGIVQMTGGSLSPNYSECIGYSGTGTFDHSAGLNKISNYYGLYLGYNSSANGTYNLSGAGILNVNSECIGYSGTGTFTHTGGTNLNSYLYLGYNAGSRGTYSLTDMGQLYTTSDEHIGYSGIGEFTQTGGTNEISSSLYLGSNSSSIGSYDLSGSGQLSAKYEDIGSSGRGFFTQTGGTNSTTYAIIGARGTYTLNAGTLNINGGLINQGVLDLSNSTAVINMSSSILNLTPGDILATAGNATINIDAHSLLIVPAGHDPAEYFATINNAGIIHQAGSALDISSDYNISGIGSIDDHVNCQGALAAKSGYNINLNGGLNISGTGSVNLGSGTLYINDGISGMESGSVTASNQYVGSTGTGTFTQSGGTNSISSNCYLGYNSGSNGTYSLSSGTNTISSYLYLGYNSGASGTYNLSGTGQLSSTGLNNYVGYSGTGMFTQTGGTNSTSYLYLGYNSGSSGTYSLSGTSQLSAYTESIGYSGTGTFTQTGGTNTISSSSYLYLGSNTGSSGSYDLSGTGSLSAGYEYIGYSGTGTFTQSAGTNTVTSELYLGRNSGSSGTYNLSGTGQLSANKEYIGYNAAAAALFHQTGGTNTATYLSIGQNAQYKFGGGTLQINGGVDNQGTFDFDSGPAVMNAANSIVNFARPGGTLKNTQAASLTIGANSLLIVPQGFDPATQFANYSNAGTLHTAGTLLTVASGQTMTISGGGTIDDQVDCQGAITAAANSSISFNGGLTISGTGAINFGSNSSFTTEATSTISGGSLSVYNHYLGKIGIASLNHSAGTNTVSGNLYLGGTPGPPTSGTGGTYNLSGTGQLLVSSSEYIGQMGMGIFNQSGGINNVSNLVLGVSPSSIAVYNLTGGTLIVSSITKPPITLPAEFNFGGGTLQAKSSFTSQVPMELTGDGGNANINTAGYSITLAGLWGPGGLNKLGNGTLSLGGPPGSYNYFTGPVNFNGGLIKAAILGGLGYSSELNFNGGGLQFAGVFDPSVRTMTFNVGGATLDTQTYNITLANPIGNGGAGGLTKMGTSTLTYQAANTYRGDTLIYAGKLKTSAANAIPNGSGYGNVIVNPTATLDLGGYNQTINGLSGFGRVDNSSDSSTYTLSVGGNNADSQFYGNIINTSGMVSLNKIGTGTFIISGYDNTYSGDTIISGGTIKLGGNLPPGLYEGMISSYFNTSTPNPKTAVQLTTVKANTSIDNYSQTWIYTGYINNPEDSDVDWTFAENYDNAAWLKIDSTVVLYNTTWDSQTSGSYTLTPGRHAFELRIGGDGVPPNGVNDGGVNSTNLGVAYDTGDGNGFRVLTDPGDGSLFTLNTSISNGCLPAASAVVMSSNTTLDLNNFSTTVGSLADASGNPIGHQVLLGTGNLTLGGNNSSTTFSGFISGTGGLTKQGDGTLTLSSSNTYSGDTIVNGGTLEIAGGIDPSGTSLIDVQSGKAVFKTVNVSESDLDINTAALATFEVLNGTHEVGNIDGSGITQVDDGASLTAASIHQGTVTIGSGAKIILKPRAGIGPLSGKITPVPEPSELVFLAGALILLGLKGTVPFFLRKNRNSPQ